MLLSMLQSKCDSHKQNYKKKLGMMSKSVKTKYFKQNTTQLLFSLSLAPMFFIEIRQRNTTSKITKILFGKCHI